jgi:hypothetical protein
MRLRVKDKADFSTVEAAVDKDCEHSGTRRSHDGSVCQVSVGSDENLVWLKAKFPKELEWHA